jgi:hypothetical protein
VGARAGLHRTDPWISSLAVHIEQAGAHLCSVTGRIDNSWMGACDGWVTSVCRLDRAEAHPAPHESCTCGFYAVKHPDHSEVLETIVLYQVAGKPMSESGVRSGMVFGRVHLAGKVIEHDLGYRAERARIADLIPTTTDGGITAMLASRLGVAVGPALDTQVMFRSFRTAVMVHDVQPQPRHLSPVDRVRLKKHQRHFRLIQGGRDDRASPN